MTKISLPVATLPFTPAAACDALSAVAPPSVIASAPADPASARASLAARCRHDTSLGPCWRQVGPCSHAGVVVVQLALADAAAHGGTHTDCRAHTDALVRGVLQALEMQAAPDVGHHLRAAGQCALDVDAAARGRQLFAGGRVTVDLSDAVAVRAAIAAVGPAGDAVGHAFGSVQGCNPYRRAIARVLGICWQSVSCATSRFVWLSANKRDAALGAHLAADDFDVAVLAGPYDADHESVAGESALPLWTMLVVVSCNFLQTAMIKQFWPRR